MSGVLTPRDPLEDLAAVAAALRSCFVGRPGTLEEEPKPFSDLTSEPWGSTPPPPEPPPPELPLVALTAPVFLSPPLGLRGAASRRAVWSGPSQTAPAGLLACRATRAPAPLASAR